MYAVRLHEFGPAENLRYEVVEDPRPAPGEVRIRVQAAGVHVIDTRLREGLPSGPLPAPALPTIPGREVAGTVDEVGADVDPAWHGQRVVAHLGPDGNGYAELAVRSVAHVHPVADELTAAIAVAMIGTGRTTMGVLEVAELTAHDVVLVTAAAGGIGGLLVQAARNSGATVVGVAGGAAKVEAVRRLGAHVAVDYTLPGWPEVVRDALDGRPVTVTLDGVGGRLGRAALELTGRGGRVLMFGWSAGEPTAVTPADVAEHGLRVESGLPGRISRRPGGIAPLEDAALAAATAGTLVASIQSFPLARAAAAHSALERRETIGKVVLVP